jgi:PAP2 superfamily
MQRKILLSCCGVILVCITAASWTASAWEPPSPDEAPADVAVAWFDLLYDLVKAEQVAPPPASRIYGVAAVALYEAIVAGSPDHVSLVGQLNDLETLPRAHPHRRYDWPAVANSALARVVRGLFPSPSAASLQAIHALEHQFASALQARLRPRLYARSVWLGQAVAEAVFAWAAADGLAVFDDCPYTPPTGPAFWQPTPPGYIADPVQPCWGALRPFVLASGAACAPPPPPAYAADPASEFYANAVQVYHTSVTLTEEQRTIAHYWADAPGTTGTPPGHWIAIVSQIARQDGLSLMAAAEGYARVGIAVADAFIACWWAKYRENLLRPVTYIQRLIDAAWLPVIVTPAFPEYPSGHSTQSAAAATVLTDLFGVRAFTDTTHRDHGLVPALAPRVFGSFEAAAAEAARSRLYGGIHYPFGNHNGLTQGRCIGQAILDRVQFKR